MTALTIEDIERQYQYGIHLGSGLPRATCPCGFCQKYREPLTMNHAYAVYFVMTGKRAIVEIEYKFADGKTHTGFHTVEVSDPTVLYEACYNRAEAEAKERGCRLERFKVGEPVYRVHLTNFGYFANDDFRSFGDAVDYAKKVGFEVSIQCACQVLATYSPIGGLKMLQ